MSFLHNVRVGFFGLENEAVPERELQLGECTQLLSELVKLISVDLQLEVVDPPRGNSKRGYIIGYAEGYPIVLKAGMLICPHLSTSFILGAGTFAAYTSLILGCSIYSDDDGRFLSLQDVLPSYTFSDMMKEVIRKDRPVQ